MNKMWNIDLWSVRPAGFKPAAIVPSQCAADSGVQLRWAHRAEPYVPLAELATSKLR
jgi:hypothetical protein